MLNRTEGIGHSTLKIEHVQSSPNSLSSKPTAVPATQIPGVDRVDRLLAHELLNLRKAILLQPQLEEFAATLAELGHGDQ